jgi:cadmium resistance protein CadD (predicted permease)
LSALDTPHFLIEASGVAAAAAASYAATNFDNLAILSAYAAKSGARPLFMKLIFVGVCLGVLLLSLGLAQAADALPKDKMRYLGLIPMGIGGYHLAKLVADRWRGEGQTPDRALDAIGVAGYLGFALALLANSSDSVVVMAPLLADLRPAFVAVCFAAAVSIAIAMAALANFVARHPAWSAHVKRLSEWALPFILITIGVLILADQPSDVFE